MSVYVIPSLTIKDAVRFSDYKRTVLPPIEKYGGRFVARGGPIHVLSKLLCEADGKLWSNYGPVIVSHCSKHASGSHPCRVVSVSQQSSNRSLDR
jgi:hypothetical protein